MSAESEKVVSIGGGGEQPRTVLVLGGGGMKGMAHIGAWKALEESGVHPDAIVGTSIGALIGACLAGGMTWRDLMEVARQLKKEDIISINRRAVWLGGVRESSVFEGDHYLDFLKRMLPVQSFGELSTPLRFNTVSLITGTEIWFGDGKNEEPSLAEAVYASCALPIYFPPGRIGGDVLVDGGVLDVFPIRMAQEWGAERIIGVDVGSDLMPPEEGYFDRGMVAIHDRVLSLNLQKQREVCLNDWDGPPLLYIRPKVGHLHAFDFERTQFFLEEGYVAARKALSEAEAA
jgi:NTE family protein